MTKVILRISPHQQAHLRLTQQSEPLLPQRTSTRKIRGSWQSTKFHNINLYSYAFITDENDPSSVTDAQQSSNGAHWKLETRYG